MFWATEIEIAPPRELKKMASASRVLVSSRYSVRRRAVKVEEGGMVLIAGQDTDFLLACLLNSILPESR